MRPIQLIQLTFSVLAFSQLASMFTPSPSLAIDRGAIAQLVIESPDRSSQTITADRIRAIMEDMKVATERKSTEGTVKAMAPFVYSEGYLKSPEGVDRYSVNRIEAHKANTQDSFSVAKEMKYLYYNVDVNVSPDGKTAYAIDKGLVDMEMLGGQRYLISTSGLTKFALVNGQIKIIYNDGTTEINSAPAL